MISRYSPEQERILKKFEEYDKNIYDFDSLPELIFGDFNEELPNRDYPPKRRRRIKSRK